MTEMQEYHNKENKQIEEKPKAITLKDRAGYYKSKSPYFTFDADLKENGYAYVVLKGWMVYRGYVKVGDPSSEATKFRLDIDNVEPPAFTCEIMITISSCCALCAIVYLSFESLPSLIKALVAPNLVIIEQLGGLVK